MIEFDVSFNKSCFIAQVNNYSKPQTENRSGYTRIMIEKDIWSVYIFFLILLFFFLFSNKYI